MATIDIPDDMNVFLYGRETVSHLYHSAMGGFWNDQPYRFEIVKVSRELEGEDWEENPPEGGVMLWCGEQYLNAIMIYNWYVSRISGAAILWDLAENPDPQYCVWVNAKWENYDTLGEPPIVLDD